MSDFLIWLSAALLFFVTVFSCAWLLCRLRYERKLRRLARKWQREVREAIPPEYSERGLGYKYLAMDNRAAGLDDAAYELEHILDQLRRR